MTEEEDFGFVIDMDRGVVEFTGGFQTPIVATLDDDDRHTDERHEIVTVVIRVPPEGLYISYDLRDFPDDVTNPTNH